MRPTCKEVTELVTDYLSNAMPPAQRARFVLHIALCTNCRRYLRQMKASIALTGALPDEPIPDAVMSELLQRFEGWRG